MSIIRLGSSDVDSGERYIAELTRQSERNFRTIISLLSSYWQSTIDGPNYAREIKAIAIELARIRLSMDEIKSDVDWRTTRTEFLYQFVTSFLFPNKFGYPDLRKTDVDFRFFLSELVKIYFKGSIPDSIEKIVELLTGENIKIKENFELSRKPGSGYDISDQFGFSIDLFIDDPGQFDPFLLDRNLKILLSIIRPSHTLYKIKLILNDEWPGTGSETLNTGKDIYSNKIQDSNSWVLDSYQYDDFRKLVYGVEGIDDMGSKKSRSIISESHDGEF